MKNAMHEPAPVQKKRAETGPARPWTGPIPNSDLNQFESYFCVRKLHKMISAVTVSIFKNLVRFRFFNTQKLLFSSV